MTDWVSRQNCSSNTSTTAAASGSEDYQEEEGESRNNLVTSHVHLRQTHSSNKDAVLRRIRHRKRMNKLTNAVQCLLGVSSSSSSNEGTSGRPTHPAVKWVDDAFAAL